jgi:hypothetical protein
MTGRNPFASIGPDDLKAIAREATSDHMSNGTDLTDAVVKAASLFDHPLTAEHVRRVCEMTYHNTFERRFHEKAGSADRMVSFDPPDAVAASSRLRAEKVASVRSTKEAAAVVGSPIMDKVASVSATGRRRHRPINAFDQVIKEASGDAAGVLWYNPVGELCYVRDQLRSSISELDTRRSTLEGSEKFAMMDLTEHAYQAYKDGVSVVGILHACLSGLDREKVASGVTSDLVDRLTFQLANIGCSLDGDEKVASYGSANPNHPLPRTFAKVAGWRNERVHVEYALDELRRDLDRVNGELRALCS